MDIQGAIKNKDANFRFHCVCKQLLKEKINTTKIEMVKADVRRFVINPQELDIWSTEYFLQLTDMMILNKEK